MEKIRTALAISIVSMLFLTSLCLSIWQTIEDANFFGVPSKSLAMISIVGTGFVIFTAWLIRLHSEAQLRKVVKNLLPQESLLVDTVKQEHVIRVVDADQTHQQTVFADWPDDISIEALCQMSNMYEEGIAPSFTNLVGVKAGKPFTREQWERVRQLFIEKGWAVDYGICGMRITRTGSSVMRYFATRFPLSQEDEQDFYANTR